MWVADFAWVLREKARRARLFKILLAFDSGWYYLETVGFQQLRGIV